MRQRANDSRGLVPDQSETVLIILDLISDFDFEDGATLARAALPVARRIARLKARAKKIGIPAIYLNDDIGRWRSDFRALVRHCQEVERARPIIAAVAPQPDDYFILKPKHSGFFEI